MGSGYVVEHCVSAFRKKQEENLFKSYTADALRAISYNTAVLPKEGYIIPRRFAELAGWVEQDDRTGDEIAADIIKRAGLRFKA